MGHLNSNKAKSLYNAALVNFELLARAWNVAWPVPATAMPAWYRAIDAAVTLSNDTVCVPLTGVAAKHCAGAAVHAAEAPPPTAGCDTDADVETNRRGAPPSAINVTASRLHTGHTNDALVVRTFKLSAEPAASDCNSGVNSGSGHGDASTVVVSCTVVAASPVVTTATYNAGAVTIAKLTTTLVEPVALWHAPGAAAHALGVGVCRVLDTSSTMSVAPHTCTCTEHNGGVRATIMYAAAPSATGCASGAFSASAVGTMGVHADAPTDAVVVPYAHAVQSVDPAAEKVLKGHTVHADAPEPDANEPLAHATHDDEPASAKLPAAQIVQDDAPASATLPVAQAVHTVAPALDANAPAAQATHAVAPLVVLNLPIAHAVHCALPTNEE